MRRFSIVVAWIAFACIPTVAISVLIFGCCADKDVTGMLEKITGGADKVIFCKVDNIRTADTDNPRGYYEYEQVKKIKEDKSWLPPTRGKAFKMISQLLYDLPASERYRILFMQRDLDEVLASQEKMLARLGRSAAGPGSP